VKCVVCGRRTGASWKRYCYAHWRQYAKGGGYSIRPSSPPQPPDPHPEYVSPKQRNKLGDIARAVAGWAFLLAMIGLPIGAVEYDSWKDDGQGSPIRQAAAPTSDSQNSARVAPTLPPAPATAQPISAFPTVAPALRPTLPAWPTFTLPTLAPAPGATTYTVQPGDSWWAIAYKFGITTDALLIANNRNYLSDPLDVGQIITIPPPAFNPVFIPYQGNGGGPTLCRDGTYSHSSGRGTCSHHGGIAR